ncbi:MAG: DUF2164 domain-containing protein [Burkholderiales bacterium]|jgi:uncharacterized protein (DUF2164 family)|nr:DUF2164 domain-containing protein [Burkholderiales bacterium]MBP9768985.1 DUF2164 domain-containing protein [Burkholderiales bacterium]
MTEIIKFAKPQQELLTQKLQQYFARELNSDLGGFDAQFLLDFIAQEIGVYFYNQGLLDAQTVLSKKVDDIQDAIGQLEKFPNK